METGKREEKIRMKRILSACLQQTIRFETRQEFEEYTAQMNRKSRNYRVDSVTDEPNGSVVVQVRKQYNEYPSGTYLD